MWRGLGQHFGQQLAAFLFDALGAEHDRRPGGERRAKFAQHTAHMLGRRHHQERVGRGHVGKRRRRADIRVERDAGEERRVLVARVYPFGHFRLARP